MIYIAQLLCPERHCILAFCHEDEFENGKEEAERFFKNGGLRKRCGICGSTKLEWENRPTAFKTMAEAAGPVAGEMVKQVITRAALESEGLTADAQDRLRNN